MQKKRDSFIVTAMKIVSVLLIIAYLLLPVLCFGNPCEMPAPDTKSTMTSDGYAEDPFAVETDNCEKTCCCAGHLPHSECTEHPYADLTVKPLPYEPHLALPRLIDRIFIPPRNHS